MKILVIQLRRIGDILLTTPALTYLRFALPAATIHFFCEEAGRNVLETHPALNDVITANKSSLWRDIQRIRRERYDVVIDYMNNPRSRYLTITSGATLRVGFKKSWRPSFYNFSVPGPGVPEYVPERKIYLAQQFLKKIGVREPEVESSMPTLDLTASDEEFARDWASKENLSEQSFALMVPVHRHPIRQWRQEGFRDVGLFITQKKGLKVYLSAGPGESVRIDAMRKGYEKEFPLLPQGTLRQTAAIFKKAKFLVTNDGGSMHLAVAVGTPTLTIYGPSRPIDWNPSLSRRNKPPIKHVAINASHLSCLGCHLKNCPIGHKCMKELTPETVIETAEKLLTAIS